MRRIPFEIGELEPQTREHAEEMFRVLSDSRLYEFEHEPPESLGWLRTRYTFLEQRSSPDGQERWLNWVIRLQDGRLAGFTQATVRSDGRALIAYMLASRHWRKGIGSRAVAAMLRELASGHEVHTFLAVLQSANSRSLGLLRKLGFHASDEVTSAAFRDGPDELVMQRSARRGTD